MPSAFSWPMLVPSALRAPAPVNQGVRRSDTVHILELELWSYPGMFGSLPEGHDIATDCTRDLGLAQEVVLGLSNIPDVIDCENLALAISKGELRTEDFISFCELNSIQPNPNDQYSAASFLSNEYGFPVAWLHIQNNDEADKVTARIAKWSTARKLCEVDPLDLYCLTLPDEKWP